MHLPPMSRKSRANHKKAEFKKLVNKYKTPKGDKQIPIPTVNKEEVSVVEPVAQEVRNERSSILSKEGEPLLANARYFMNKAEKVGVVQAKIDKKDIEVGEKKSNEDKIVVEDKDNEKEIIEGEEKINEKEILVEDKDNVKKIVVDDKDNVKKIVVEDQVNEKEFVVEDKDIEVKEIQNIKKETDVVVDHINVKEVSVEEIQNLKKEIVVEDKDHKDKFDVEDKKIEVEEIQYIEKNIKVVEKKSEGESNILVNDKNNKLVEVHCNEKENEIKEDQFIEKEIDVVYDISKEVIIKPSIFKGIKDLINKFEKISKENKKVDVKKSDAKKTDTPIKIKEQCKEDTKKIKVEKKLSFKDLCNKFEKIKEKNSNMGQLDKGKSVDHKIKKEKISNTTVENMNVDQLAKGKLVDHKIKKEKISNTTVETNNKNQERTYNTTLETNNNNKERTSNTTVETNNNNKERTSNTTVETNNKDITVGQVAVGKLVDHNVNKEKSIKVNMENTSYIKDRSDIKHKDLLHEQKSITQHKDKSKEKLIDKTEKKGMERTFSFEDLLSRWDKKINNCT